MSNTAIVRVVKDVITVEPRQLKPEKVPATITWELKTDGWSFTDTGIVIEKDTGGQFSNGGRRNKGTVFTWDDKNNDGKEYKYNIRVQQGTQVLSLDPTILNKQP